MTERDTIIFHDVAGNREAARQAAGGAASAAAALFLREGGVFRPRRACFYGTFDYICRAIHSVLWRTSFADHQPPAFFMGRGHGISADPRVDSVMGPLPQYLVNSNGKAALSLCRAPGIVKLLSYSIMYKSINDNRPSPAQRGDATRPSGDKPAGAGGFFRPMYCISKGFDYLCRAIHCKHWRTSFADHQPPAFFMGRGHVISADPRVDSVMGPLPQCLVNSNGKAALSSCRDPQVINSNIYISMLKTIGYKAVPTWGQRATQAFNRLAGTRLTSRQLLHLANATAAATVLCLTLSAPQIIIAGWLVIAAHAARKGGAL